MNTIQKLYAENEPAMNKNKAVPNDLQGKFYTVEAYDKTPVNCNNPLAFIEAVKNQRQPKTNDLGTLLGLTISA